MIAPLFLLADSQLLFSQGSDNGLPGAIRTNLRSSDPKAAYIGASNSDRVEFYDLFTGAMDLMEISRCRMVPSQPSDDDRRFLEEADLVLLAGGDVELGWQVFEQNGLKDLMLKKRYDGSILIGTSAGAVQLGLGALTNASQPKKLNLFGFAPFYVDAHEEKEEWWNLRALVNLSQSEVRGVGISAGGGAVYWPDGTLEPLRHALTEVAKENERVVERVIVPLKPAASV